MSTMASKMREVAKSGDGKYVQEPTWSLGYAVVWKACVILPVPKCVLLFRCIVLITYTKLKYNYTYMRALYALPRAQAYNYTLLPFFVSRLPSPSRALIVCIVDSVSVN
jgi:hypothetical protein